MSAPVTGLLGRACGAAAAVAAGGTWRSYCPSWLAMNGREKMFHATTLNCVALSLAHVAMTGGLGLHNTCENADRWVARAHRTTDSGTVFHALIYVACTDVGRLARVPLGTPWFPSSNFFRPLRRARGRTPCYWPRSPLSPRCTPARRRSTYNPAWGIRRGLSVRPSRTFRRRFCRT